ncbi:MAG: hypothetical protein WCF17_09045 [Terracidiphilus sp.]
MTEVRPDLPADLARIIRRCLEKDPRRRMQTARDVSNEFREMAQPASRPVPVAAPASRSIAAADSGAARADDGFWVAVLPFKSSGTGSDLVALAEGITDDIVTGMSKFSYLRVIARSSTARYANQAVDVRAAAEELGAQYVMEGSIRQAGPKVRIAVQLVDAIAGAGLWAETYDRAFTPEAALDLLDDVVPRIVATVGDTQGILAHSMTEALRGRDPETFTPYEALLRSFGFHQHANAAEHLAGRMALERAVREAPDRAECWAMLSWFYRAEHTQGYNPRPDAMDRCLEAARRAVNQAPSNQLAQAALASAFFFRHELGSFRPAAERALALNSMEGYITAYLGMHFAYAGDWDKGCALAERATKLNPNHPGSYWLPQAMNAYRQSDSQRALEIALRINMPGLWSAQVALTVIYSQLGNFDEAQRALRDLLALRPEFATTARRELAKWWLPDMVEQIIGDLRKAGLDIPDAGAAATRTSSISNPRTASGGTRADEGFWVAVLPFKAQGASAELAALADGLSEEIVTGLSRFSYLRVIARGSTLSYANRAIDLRVAGQELGASYAMEGTLRQAGARLRVAVQLIDAVTGVNLWAENYERAFSPEAVFELQDDLVPRIVSTVADHDGVLPQSMAEVLRKKSEEQLTPHETLLRTFAFFKRFDAEEHALAKRILENAVRTQPENSDCWAMLSHAYSNGYWAFGGQQDSLDRGLAAARRAVDAGPSNHLSHWALALALFLRRDFSAFRVAAERAIALNRMDGSTVAFMGHLIAYSGDWERGCAIAEPASALNPNHAGWHGLPAFFNSYRKGEYKDALAAALRLNMPGHFQDPAARAAAHAQLGERDAAQQALKELLVLQPDFAEMARGFYLKWQSPELVEHLIDGWRKAGLDIPAAHAAPASSLTSTISTPRTASGGTRADEGFWVAVLPFKYTGASADLKALAEGISDEIVTGLSRFSYLRVVARGSTTKYSSESGDIRTIGKELGARYVLEGNLRQAGSKLRLAVQLTDTTSGAHLWAETYEHAFTPESAFEVQDDLVPPIVATVADPYGALPRSIGEVLRNKSDDELSPYEAVLSAFSYFSRITLEEHAVVRTRLERTVRKAPDHADSWAMLSIMYRIEFAQGFNAGPNPLDRALAAAQRAVDLAPANALGHFALATIHFFRKEMIPFRVAAERALALNPLDGSVIGYLATIIAASGEWDRGCQMVESAIKLNPNYPGWFQFPFFSNAYRLGKYEEALAAVARANTPGYFHAHAAKAAILGQLGRREEAQKAVQDLLALRPDFGAVARQEYEKWYLTGEIEHVLDGLRKAGLNMPGEDQPAAPSPKIETSGKLASGMQSIAVLPFANLSADPDQEYFSDGLADEIINALTHVAGLKVIARTSAFSFKGRNEDIRKIGELLGVTSILEGSVRRSGSRMRVTAQLINADDGCHLWSERFDREATDVFSVQDEIAASIAKALKVTLRGESSRGHQPSLPAYEAFLKGRHHYYKFSPEAFTRAEVEFQRAAALDPQWADPHSALSDLYLSFGFYGWRPPEEMAPLARSAAHRALELLPDDPMAHSVLAAILGLHDRDWAESESHFHIAQAGGARSTNAIFFCAVFHLLPLGRFDEARREMEKVVALDPLSAFWRARLAWISLNEGNYNDAIASSRAALELDENDYPARMVMALALYCAGNAAEARVEIENAYRIAPFDSFCTGIFAGMAANAGDRARANELIANMTGSIPVGKMMYHLLCSEIDASLDWFEKDLELRRFNAPMLACAAFLEPLRSSPRWPNLMKIMGMPRNNTSSPQIHPL